MNRSLVFVLPLLLGCSSSDSDSTPAAGDAPAPIAITSSAAAIKVTAMDNGGAERLVMGAFLDGYRPGTSCQVETVAGCKVSVCTQTDDAAKGTPIDPGMLTTSSPTIGTEVAIPITQGYARLVQAGAFPDVGEEVRVVGTGSGMLSGFDLKVKLPNKAALESFAGCAPGAKCDVSSGAQLLKWTGGAGGFIAIGFGQSLDSWPKTSMTCWFAAEAGKGKVPAEALAKLPRASYSMSFIAAATPVGSDKVALDAIRTSRGVTVTLK